jgi:3-isopropylmalate dehydrogenase
MLLRHSAGLMQDAMAIEASVRKVLTAGHRTADLLRGVDTKQQAASTSEMGSLVEQTLRSTLDANAIQDQRQATHAV